MDPFCIVLIMIRMDKVALLDYCEDKESRQSRTLPYYWREFYPPNHIVFLIAHVIGQILSIRPLVGSQ